MNNSKNLEGNLKVLLEKWKDLNLLQQKVGRRRKQQMEGWLLKVNKFEHEVNDIKQDFDEIERGLHSNKRDSRIKLNRKVNQSIETVQNLEDEGKSSLESMHGSFLKRLERNKIQRFWHGELRTFTSNFSCEIGSGGFGQVYKGQLPDGFEVAVKVLKEVDADIVEETFMAEVETMGGTSHRNLVRLFGFCFDISMKALVYEYMENGSLDRILYEKHTSIEWGKLYDIAVETAMGLSYLHDDWHQRIIHHDVKPANVLIDKNHSPKLTDFGLAKLMNRDVSHVVLTRTRGTPGYIAPEMITQESKVSYKCDVYSYGMMLFEILGRTKKIYDGKPFHKQVWEQFQNSALDQLLEECGIAKKDREKAMVLAMVALWCVQHPPEYRPRMKKVVMMLESEIEIPTPPNPYPQYQPMAFPSLFRSDLLSSVQSSQRVIQELKPQRVIQEFKPKVLPPIKEREVKVTQMSMKKDKDSDSTWFKSYPLPATQSSEEVIVPQLKSKALPYFRSYPLSSEDVNPEINLEVSPPRNERVVKISQGSTRKEEDSGSSSRPPMRKTTVVHKRSPQNKEPTIAYTIKSVSPELSASKLMLESFEKKCLPGGENSVIIYTTTLKAIRGAFNACNYVRSTLQSYQIEMVERDLHLDESYKYDLREVGVAIKCPAVFVKGRYIGGAKELRKVEEEGKMRILLHGIPRVSG